MSSRRPPSCTRSEEEFYDFSLDEIRQQLEALGFKDVPTSQLMEFKRDLDLMIGEEMGSVASSVIDDDTPRGLDETTECETDDGWNERCTAYRSGDFYNQNYGKQMKRKTVRRDESYTEPSSASEAGDDYPRNGRPTSQRWYGDPGRHARFLEDPVVGVLDYSRETNSNNPLSARSASSSIIKSARSQVGPKQRGYRKADPVSRYRQYNQVWQIQRAPGEADHRQLRWAVKEAMMVHEVPRKRPTTPTQNMVNYYVPPTEDHRQNLRWNVRQELADYGMPSSARSMGVSKEWVN